jgi:hypothetical protein
MSLRNFGEKDRERGRDIGSSSKNVVCKIKFHKEIML